MSATEKSKEGAANGSRAADGRDKHNALEVRGATMRSEATKAVDTAGGDDGKNQATILVQLAGDADLFHDAEGSVYASVPVSGHRENYALKGNSFKQWLSRQFWNECGKPPGSQAMHDALVVLTGMGLFDGPERSVWVRLATHDGAFYLDLCDEQWRAVEITATGWRVVENPPVKFIRRKGMLPLPIPVKGGSIDELRRFVNVADDSTWVLIKAFMLGSMHPKNKYPILGVNGEHGSAKTTLCRMIRATIDPNHADLRSAPRDERDLMIAAANGWMVAFDNLSLISGALSDALCRLATGGGFATRALYTDDDEKLFNAARPVIFNGIEELGTRADLIDRVILVVLPAIPPERRKPEHELWTAFETAKPRILGALLTAVSAAMRNLPSVDLATLPRMADFAKWVVAGEQALGIAPGAFLRAYNSNRDMANSMAIEASPIGAAILSLVDGCEGWSGTSKELLRALSSDRHSDQDGRRRHDWPRNPHKLANTLRRLAPNLRKIGVETTFPGHRSNRGRVIVLERISTGRSPSSPLDGGATAEGTAEQARRIAQARDACDVGDDLPRESDGPAANKGT